MVLESEAEFRDRVRGEVMAPWGAAEARNLGLTDVLLQAGAKQIRWCNNYIGAQQTDRRDLPATTLPKSHLISVYHPRMQTHLLEAAAAAGAAVRRGVTVTLVAPGSPPRVRHSSNDRIEEISARMVVVAEGRNCQFRRQAGFMTERDTHSYCLAGVYLEAAELDENSFYLFTNIERGELVAWAPQGDGRARAYLGFWKESRPRFQGSGDFARFLGEMNWTGIAEEHVANAKQAGPLATFEGADHWVEHPYKNGIALVGDAAGASDPAWGLGLSLAVRGVRHLRDALLANENWEIAGQEYARAQSRDYQRVRMVTGWYREFFLDISPAGHARRARALPRIAQDATRIPDVLFSGPDVPLAANAQQRFFGEDAGIAPA